MWVNEAALASIPKVEPTRGRPRLYSDALIQALHGLKTMFRLPLLAPQGFAQSLRDLAFATLPVPNYTTLCRWACRTNSQATEAAGSCGRDQPHGGPRASAIRAYRLNPSLRAFSPSSHLIYATTSLLIQERSRWRLN